MSTIEHEMQIETQEWDSSLATVRYLEISSEQDFAFASDLVKLARSNWKRLEEKRTGITKPILESKAKVDELFKPALDRLKEIENTLKVKIGAYTVAQKQAQERAMLVSAQEYAAGGTPTAIIPEVPHAAGVTVKESWDFEITDPMLVPRDFCSPDVARIRAFVNVTPPQNLPRIPGLRFFKRTDTVVRVK